MRNRFHFIRQGKRHAQTIAALLLAGVMSMAPAGMAFAESEADDEPQTEAEAADTTYAGYLGAAVDAAAIMESRAQKDQIVLSEDEEVWDFGTIEASDPKMALIYFPSQKQREELASVSDASGTGVVKPISNEINSRYSENYAKLAEGLYQEGEYDPAAPDRAGSSDGIV